MGETRLIVEAGLAAASPDIAVINTEESSFDDACWPVDGALEGEEDVDIEAHVGYR